jgi:hypothetical protein
MNITTVDALGLIFGSCVLALGIARAFFAGRKS